MEARALAEAGHQVTWITSQSTGLDEVPAYPAAVQVVRVPAWHILEHKFGIAYPLFGPGLLTTLWRSVGQADVVHAHGFVFLNSVLSLVMAYLRRKPSLLTDHGGLHRYSSQFATFLMRLAVESLGRISARLATQLVAYNQRVGQLLQRLSGQPDKLLFLPNPVDRQRFYPVSPDVRCTLRNRWGWNNRPKVIFVGRLVEDKGVRRLLAAADCSFDLLFCGPAEPDLQQLVEQSGATYLPPRPSAELPPLYQAADVLALPSWNEGFPLVIQEALCCGLPVVTCYDPGYAPYASLPGLTFCEPSPASLRACLLSTLSHPPLSTEPGDFFPTQQTWVVRLIESISQMS